MSKRFQVIDSSQSAHCCFGYTVIDTAQPEEYVSSGFKAVCECFDEADAKLIADALNKLVNEK